MKQGEIDISIDESGGTSEDYTFANIIVEDENEADADNRKVITFLLPEG